MAQIPLAQIPNAPDLASMSAPQTNSVNIPTVDFTQERREVARAYSSAEQNSNNAGFIGKAIAGVGDQVGKVANSYMKQQEDLQATAAKAEFEGLNKTAMDQVATSIDPTQPHTFLGAYNQAYQSVDDWYKAQPANIQRAVYPDYIHARYMNQANVGILANKTQIANDRDNTLAQVNQLASNGDYGTAYSLVDGLLHSNVIDKDKKNEIYSQIDGTRQQTQINQWIQSDPDKAISTLKQAVDTGSTLPGFDQIRGKELENKLKVAQGVKNWQTINAQTKVSSWVDENNGKLTMQAIEASAGFKALDDAGKQAVRDQFLNKYVAGTEEGAAATASAIGSVKQYNPSLDPDFSNLKDLTNQLIGTVPQNERQPLLDELTKKHDDFLKNGGRVPFDKQIITDIHGQIHQMYSSGALDDRARFAKGTPEYNKEVQKGLQKYQYYVNQWDKMSAENPGNLGEAQQNFNQVIMKDDAKNSIKPVQPSSGGGILNFLRGSKPQQPSWMQSSNDGFQPIGDKAWSVTSYGYPGDSTPDDNSKAGIGAFTKHLTRDSFGTSYDVEDKLRQAGVKPGDKVDFKLSNGQVVTKIWHDRGATPEQARRMGLRNYYGRVDLYSPDAPHELAKQGVKVVGFKPYIENGQG
jgi:hypothetical protein